MADISDAQRISEINQSVLKYRPNEWCQHLDETHLNDPINNLWQTIKNLTKPRTKLRILEYRSAVLLATKPNNLSIKCNQQLTPYAKTHDNAAKEIFQ